MADEVVDHFDNLGGLNIHHPTRTDSLYVALCASADYFRSARLLEASSKKSDEWPSRFVEVVARRSLSSHFCSMGIEFSFKVFRAFTVLDSGSDGVWRETHKLLELLDDISKKHALRLEELYEEHCLGKLNPVVESLSKSSGRIKGADLGSLRGFCEYVDQRGKWDVARYQVWQQPHEWMYRVIDLDPVLHFLKALIELARKQLDEYVPIRYTLVNDDDVLIVNPVTTKAPVKKEEYESRSLVVEMHTSRPKESGSAEKKVCPECRHVFQGNGWDGIDAHWRSKHEAVMPYEDAWPLLRDGKYTPPLPGNSD